MAVWDEQNMIALSIESTKDIVFEYIVLIKKGTDKTKEVVEWCKSKWNLNIRIIETDIKLREARKLAVELTKEYADYYLIQDGDEIYFTEDELKNIGRETITELMYQSYDHCETTIIYLYHDLLHTKVNNTWLVPHPFLIKNLPEIFWPEKGDLPYLLFDWNNKKYKLYNSDIQYKSWDNGLCETEFREKNPFKFDCNIKNYSRLFKREIFTAWHDGNSKVSIEEYCLQNDSRCIWYKENIHSDVKLEEIIEYYEKKDNLLYIEKYDESKFYQYPTIIKNYINLGLLKGINNLNDLENQSIKLFYYNTEEIGNLGDILSRYIIKKISGIEPLHYFNSSVDEFKDMKDPNLLSTGSILNFANKNSIIWGSGIIDNGWSMNWDIKNILKDSIACVRGPLTSGKLKDKINITVDKFGDPSLILKDLYEPNIKKRYKLGIIPHLNDELFIKELKITDENIKIISLRCENNDDSIEDKIDEILECELVISSSLHGLIIPIIYDIPVFYFRRVKDYYQNDIDDLYHSEIMTKYKDFFYSIYSKEYLPEIKIDWNNFLMEEVIEKFNFYKHPTLITNRINDLLTSYPFKKLLSDDKIYYITTRLDESTHVNFAMLKSKYKSKIVCIDYENSKKINFNKNDIYFLNCLASSDMAKFFLELKTKEVITKLVLHCSGNLDFVPIKTLNMFDLIFYETLYTYKRSYIKEHINNLRSFGINTEIFKNKNLEKKYDYIWVGSINDYLKKFTEITKLVDDKNSKILFVGDLYNNEDKEKISKLLTDGYNIEIKPRCSLMELSYYYNISKCLLLTQPEYGGGERCLLEAKYCGLEIKILNNVKLTELNEENIIFDIEYFTNQIDLGLEKIIYKHEQ